MPIKISFDLSNNPEVPIFVLATKKGKKLGQIVAEEIVCSDSLKDASEFSFKVRKYVDGKKYKLWDEIKNFKLIWCKNYDIWYQITVDINETTETVKTIYGTRLGHAELGQIILYNIEINTENDIVREDYDIPSVMYDEEHPKSSILHRLLEKAPHYSIIHVDSTIKNIQRTFTFDGISIYDAFQEIGEEIGCLFIFNSNSDENGNIQRTISVYDIQSNCHDCGYRGEFTGRCPKCDSTYIDEGYGYDTTIFITSDELGDDIQFTTDTGSVKNCFKLEAGDDLMTATIRNCNPNGTDYIWHISDDVKEDMSDKLVEKLESYDNLYNYYQNIHQIDIDIILLSKYNDLVLKYQSYNSDLKQLTAPINGYPALMNFYYNTIDLSVYLQSSLMPDITLNDTSASQQVALLTEGNFSHVSVEDVSKISLASANSAVLSMAKIIVDSRYQVKVDTSELTNRTWTGNFIVTSYSNEEDTATSDIISITIDDDYELYVKQKIEKSLSNDNTEDLSITGLFKKDYNSFVSELKKYCLDSLIIFYDSCQACINILIEQGISNGDTWGGSDSNLYDNLYKPYYDKLGAIEDEMKVRQDELNLINGIYDVNGDLVSYGIQTYIAYAKNFIQDALNFQDYLGEELWLEFCSYRREDKYSNENYISDGLNNAELFNKALEFIEIATNEIYKSAELQHSISAKLKNLLVIKKFKKLVQYFEVGNWIRVLVDDEIFKLRLLSYEIDFDNLENITVEFSDVMKTASGETDQRNLIQKASSMATSYSSTKKQASQGAKSQDVLNDWYENGLNATNVKITGGADNQSQSWDRHGMLFRKYNPITDTYSDTQLKIINSTLSITDDNWKTFKTGIGKFIYFDPEGKQYKEGYGIIADTICSNLILSKRVGIYNEETSIELSQNGFVVTTNTNNKNVFTIQRNSQDLNGNISYDKQLYIDDNGNIVLGNNAKIIWGDGEIKNICDLSTDYANLKEILGYNGTIITGTYIYSPHIVGGELSIGDETGTYAKILSNGILECSGAKISGTMYASDGNISGWDIKPLKICGGDSEIGVAVMQVPSASDSSVYTFASGGKNHNDYSDCPFRVTKYGDLYAEKATISGDINATNITALEKYRIYSGDNDVEIISTNSDKWNANEYEIYVGILNDKSNGYITFSKQLKDSVDGSKNYYSEISFYSDDVVFNGKVNMLGDIILSGKLTISQTTNMLDSLVFSNTKGIRSYDSSGIDYPLLYISDEDIFSVGNANLIMMLKGSYIETQGSLYLGANIVTNNNNAYYCKNVAGTNREVLKIDNSDNCLLGSPNHTSILRGTSVKLSDATGAIVTSDKRKKTDVKTLEEKHMDFLMELNPVSFHMIGKEDEPLRYGFIAQEVEEILIKHGMTSQDFAGINVSIENGEKVYGLIYEQFIPLIVYELQNLRRIVNTQQSEIKELKKRYKKNERKVYKTN